MLGFPTSFLIQDYLGERTLFNIEKILDAFFYDFPKGQVIPPWDVRLFPLPLHSAREQERTVIIRDKEEAKEVEVQMAVAGFEPGDIIVTHDGKVVTIEGSNEERKPVAQKFRRKFTHSFTVGENLDLDGIRADLRHGVLSVKIPLRVREVSTTQVPIGEGEE